MAKKKRGGGVGRLAVIILFLMVAVVVAWLWIGPVGDDGTAPAPEPTAEEAAPPEPDLPGESFQASGTILALPGAPTLPINLWDNPDRSSGVVHVVGQLSPGQSVAVTRRYRHIEEDQLYYRVASGELVGWLPETRVDVGQ